MSQHTSIHIFKCRVNSLLISVEIRQSWFNNIYFSFNFQEPAEPNSTFIVSAHFCRVNTHFELVNRHVWVRIHFNRLKSGINRLARFDWNVEKWVLASKRSVYSKQSYFTSCNSFVTGRIFYSNSTGSRMVVLPTSMNSVRSIVYCNRAQILIPF